MSGDADLARISALIGEPSRARVLMALTDGRALPAGEAGVSASTISEHLHRLLDAHLVAVERQGRTRRYRLAGPRSPRRWRRSRASRRRSRSGRCARAPTRTRSAAPAPATTTSPDGWGRAHGRAPAGRGARRRAPSRPGGRPARRTRPRRRLPADARGAGTLDDLGVDPAALRVSIRYCLAWSEQRHHLAGPLGTALTDRLFALGWLRRADRRRIVLLTDAGRAGLGRLGVPEDWDA